MSDLSPVRGRATPARLLFVHVALTLAAAMICAVGTVQAADSQKSESSKQTIAFPSADKATLVSRLLAEFDMPREIALDPLSDDSETARATRMVEDAITDQGITINPDAEYVLEIEVDPAATGAYLKQRGDPLQSGAYHDGRRDNPVDELAPSRALSPSPGLQEDRRLMASRPHMSVILILYPRQQSPVWMAQATIARDDRRTVEQAGRLARLSMDHFAESAVVGFDAPKKSEE